MRFTIEHSWVSQGSDPELHEQDGVIEFAQAVEKAGFHTIAFTEHPAPSAKWLHAGGHVTFDPLAALAFCAAVTRRVQLMTYVLVLPYRNPLVTAKTVATVDRLSGGRLNLGVGGGYLRSEFAAVGSEFERRGALFDEALDVLSTVWTEDSFSHEGIGFTARSVVSVPGPVQRPHPPIWIGGNGQAARRRVARLAKGWMPLMLGERQASTSRTTALTTPAEVASEISELKNAMVDAGRDPDDVSIQIHTPQADLGDGFSVEQRRDHLGELAEAGVTDFVVTPPGSSLSLCLDALAGYARDVAGLEPTQD